MSSRSSVSYPSTAPSPPSRNLESHPAETTPSPINNEFHDIARSSRHPHLQSVDGELTDLDAVSLAIQPEYDHPLRRYGLEQLLQVVGVATTPTSQGVPVIYYGHDQDIGRRAAIWIPPGLAHHFTDQSPANATPEFAEIKGTLIPYSGSAPRQLWHGNQTGFDPALATAFWLTLSEERFASTKDSHGRMPSYASKLSRHGAHESPPIHAYAKLLREQLKQILSQRSWAPLWPYGKHYAVALSHDVDAPERPSRIGRLLHECVAGQPRPRKYAYWDLRAELRGRGGLRHLLLPMHYQPEWDFAKLCELENQLNLRSAFYFCVQNRRRGHPCDPPYNAAAPQFCQLYRHLASSGWEIGLHAAYQTYTGIPSMESQLERLRELSNAPVAGLRHHYLMLDPKAPLRTLANHASVRAWYDTSVGYNDAPGFRAGIALPYCPFDPDRQQTSELVELPMTISDMHLSSQDRELAIETALRHIQTVRLHGGLAMLNWHVGNWHSAPGWRESYRAICEMVAKDDSAWVARPCDIAAWWRQRSKYLHRRTRG